MKLFKVSTGEEESKCGCCNWNVTDHYWMAETQEEADKEVAEMNPDEQAPLCGACMCDLLVQNGYNITRAKISVLIGIWGGCLEDIKVVTNPHNAQEVKKQMLKDYNLTEADIPDNAHSKECRWNDENEVHLHEVEID